MNKLDPHGIEVIKDKFYFTTIVPQRPDTTATHYFTVEDELTYEPFFADFGPLNLGHVYSYCRFLDQKIKDESLANKRIFHYSSMDSAKRTNAIFLIGTYCVLVLRWTAEITYRQLAGGGAAGLLPFRDASVGPSTFGLTVLDCWRGLIKANELGYFDLATFDPNEYYFYERVENGDMNWIVPGKFLAFSGPHASHHSDAGLRTLTPDDYIPYFKKHNVVMVVRLNKKVYDKKRFTDYGVKHTDLYFVDGSTPSDSIVQKFLEVVEAETPNGGAIAVHCKAGLGRTGTLIACSLMKHNKFTAQEAIGWLRRPGSVIGPQQHFLVQMQNSLWKEGDLFRKKQQYDHTAKLMKTPKQPQPDYVGTVTVAGVGYTNGSEVQSKTGAPSRSDYTNYNPSSDGVSVPPPSQNITTKERLKADMRLITATLKSMRTTPPTSPTITQPAPKYSQYAPSQLDPYANPNTPPLTSSSSYGTSPASPASTSSTSSYYLNSPYAAQPTRTYKSTTTNSPTTGSPTGKGKLPSGLSLQHRKIENQANRHGPTTPTTRSLQSSAKSNASSVTSKPGSRSSIYDRHTSPSTTTTSTTTTTTNRPLYSTHNSTPSTSPYSAASAGTKQPYHRKSRSSGNLLSAYNPATPPTVTPTVTPLTSGSRTTDFNMHTNAPPRMRSASNSSPSSAYSHSSTSSSSSSSSSLAPPSNAVSRSKTPPPPRRHPSAPRNIITIL